MIRTDLLYMAENICLQGQKLHMDTDLEILVNICGWKQKRKKKWTQYIYLYSLQPDNQ